MYNNLNKIVAAIREANDNGALIDRNDVLTGYSGEALFGTLQRLSKEILTEDTCYVEVGVFQGLTLLSSALAAPQQSFYGIDNFAFFDKGGKNEQLIKNRISKLNLNNVHLINNDYEDALENLKNYIGNKKVAIYFIDGPHDYRSQMMCLLLIKPYLADNAVILIDDSNYRHVRQANRDFLVSHPEFKLLYQSYSKAHPSNLSADETKEVRKNWWNGINIIYRDSSNELAPFLPDTIRDRSIYENENNLHAAQYPEQLLLLWKIAKKLWLFPLLNLVKNPKEIFKGKYRSCNTYSENLPKNDMNIAVSKSI